MADQGHTLIKLTHQDITTINTYTSNSRAPKSQKHDNGREEELSNNTSLTLLDRRDKRSKILRNKFNQGGVRHTHKIPVLMD